MTIVNVSSPDISAVDFGAARLAHCRMPSGDSVAATLPKSTTLREDMLAWLDWPNSEWPHFFLKIDVASYHLALFFQKYRHPC